MDPNYTSDAAQVAKVKKTEEIAYDIYIRATSSGRFRGPLQGIQWMSEREVPAGKKPYWSIALSCPATLDMVIRVYGPSFFIVNRNGNWTKHKSLQEILDLLQDPFQGL